MNSDEPIGLSWVVISGLIRLTTHPRIVQESEAHWNILKSRLEKAGTADNLTTDAHLAALAIGSGSVLISCGNEFTRFEKLRWMSPLNG